MDDTHKRKLLQLSIFLIHVMVFILVFYISGKKKWTPQEQRVVMSEFEKYMHLNKLPGKSECEILLKENLYLSRRSWRNIKTLFEIRQRHLSSIRKIKTTEERTR